MDPYAFAAVGRETGNCEFNRVVLEAAKNERAEEVEIDVASGNVEGKRGSGETSSDNTRTSESDANGPGEDTK